MASSYTITQKGQVRGVERDNSGVAGPSVTRLPRFGSTRSIDQYRSDRTQLLPPRPFPDLGGLLFACRPPESPMVLFGPTGGTRCRSLCRTFASGHTENPSPHVGCTVLVLSEARSQLVASVGYRTTINRNCRQATQKYWCIRGVPESQNIEARG
jgi:hypothetical protein